jgi:bifunctional non-homologous end joining protein LigD
MALQKYHEKRNFDETPEPTGGKPLKGSLRFVVQKHDASHLHYDFRLEMEGVLKSWAVPKGPSLDPEVKRLAMMVEDHPFDYRKFEGIIPSGYGAGTVIVWDEGTYLPAEPEGKTKKEHDAQLLRELKKGKVKVRLDGSKLKGDFALVKAYGRGENSWLLMKLEDEFSTAEDIREKDRSVLSDKTLAEMEEDPENVYGKKASSAGKKKPAAKAEDKESEKDHSEDSEAPVESGATPVITDEIRKLIKEGRKKRFSPETKPMLATLADGVFDDPGWQFEIKWDGYRALALVSKGKIELKSRNDKSYNERFFPVYNELKTWNVDVVIDGEVIVANSEGRSDFGALQNWRTLHDGQLLYYVFDILWLDGTDLTGLPLSTRRKILELLVKDSAVVRLSESYGGSGTEFFEAAKNLRLEGIMAKKSDSLYNPGGRTREWLKIKTGNRQEMVIGGYTKKPDSPKLFSALLLGVFDGDDFIFKGKVGTGFNTADQKELMAHFEKLERKTSPFASATPREKVNWLSPELVCEVNYSEMTSEGIMRHPSYIALRTDKPASEVKMEEKAAVKKSRKKK